ncbi:hypothetical protein VM1G_02158 [Cytospora mali]|uniref:Serine hydrolase domain-containing protein n=1 Tax=Cytospora mali TaxID=578113 RepID=A0A194VS66_CYTMA|nr:hypothetical protein VM1G_02158 [Valsa mali]
MVRILCLHGMGVNAEIFALQTESLRATLPATYEFVFTDGPVDCDAAPGVGDIFTGPYRCWYNTPTTAKVKTAHNFVDQFIKEHGSFDGGSAVAASMILHHQLENPRSAEPLFRFAIFLASPMPFARTLDYGIDTRKYFGLAGVLKPIRADCMDKIPLYLLPDKAYLRGAAELDGDQAANPAETFYQMFHPSADTERICIPTAHVYGLQDPWCRHSADMVLLCDQSVVSVLVHDGGHDVPKDLTEEMSDLIENTVGKAGCFDW